jgi:DNA-binding transcriptional regulator LsrR (DeoR family)
MNLNQDSDQLLCLAARLYYIDELDQNKVAELVGVSRSNVSRLLARARKKGIVRISVDEYEPRNTALEQKLVERFNLHHAVVVRVPKGADQAHTRRTIGYFAAPVIQEVIRNATTLGVAGGRTLQELVSHFSPNSNLGGVTVVQLMGNVGTHVTQVDAIEISRTLASRLGGNYCMLDAPAFAPDSAIRQIYTSHEHIRSVWQLYGVMQVALIGVGSLVDSVFIDRGMITPKDIQGLRDQGIIGEICGRFFDKDGLECPSQYRDRVISIGLEELREKSEVIGVTHGSHRAAAVRAAIQGGIIKSLVIDEAGAQAVIDSNNPEDGRRITQE